ncbi:MFS transporter [Herbaspirillum lusitanum]|uniref:MFS transporter n=1 Tax=Herbaspirillum lusitanum TaxID=213312 RepID=UPI00031C0F87|nr:MFS transporter [Herbaspirillum lusitanum]
MKNESRLRYFAYGLLGLPLAMSALPVYIQAPLYYSSYLGATLAGTGWVLFLARVVDTVQDPWLGQCIDKLQGTRLHLWMMLAGALLALAFFGIWLPPASVRVSGAYLLAWLGVMLVVAYTAHSMLNIAYLAWGARLSEDAGGLLGASALRELMGLLGAVLASVIPGVIMASGARSQAGFALYSGAFAVAVAVSLAALLWLAPRWNKVAAHAGGWRSAVATMRSNPGFRRLLLPYFLNAVSVAIPATLALFFINDRLQAPDYAGGFLATYFISTAIGLPLWVVAAQRVGVLPAWRIGMLLAVLAFGGTVLLGAGDVLLYGAVCVAAGLALGADLALPPVLLANVIGSNESTAAYYGVWTLLAKLALAFSGLALPLLALFDYQPGMSGNAALGWTYAAVPCVFKLMALLLLRTAPASDSLAVLPETSS